MIHGLIHAGHMVKKQPQAENIHVNSGFFDCTLQLKTIYHITNGESGSLDPRS